MASILTSVLVTSAVATAGRIGGVTEMRNHTKFSAVRPLRLLLTHPLKLLRPSILPSPPAHLTKDKKLEPEIPDDSPELPAPAQGLEDHG